MCQIPKDHECFKWKFKHNDRFTSFFTFHIVDGKFGYKKSNENRFYVWDIPVEYLETNMKSWAKAGFIDPAIPPVISKIREMHLRQERKRNV